MRRKRTSLPRLLALRRSWARAEKRVVFTNGVFDILHPGHVDLLARARALGDILILGLNEDVSVRMLGKGPDRPINPFKDRAAVLEGLAAVDWIVGFREKTPEALIRRLRPDVLVKGADYSPSQVAGVHYAGRVALLPLKKGYSTTKLVERLRRVRPVR